MINPFKKSGMLFIHRWVNVTYDINIHTETALPRFLSKYIYIYIHTHIYIHINIYIYIYPLLRGWVKTAIFQKEGGSPPPT